MREQRFIESFNASLEGFIYVLKTQRNMRIHYLASVLIILLGIWLNLSITELMILSVTITIVLVAEMANTAMEHMVDIVKTELHPLAKIIKDVAAGSVLVASINAVIIGYILFSGKTPFNVEEGLSRVRQSPWHVSFIALILVFSLAVIGKVIFHKGTPLRGGMPSGHAAVAFAVWTIVTFLTTNSIVIILTFLMAFLIARHRIKDAVHTIWEVAAGSLLGILGTILIFQLLK